MIKLKQIIETMYENNRSAIDNGKLDLIVEIIKESECEVLGTLISIIQENFIDCNTLEDLINFRDVLQDLVNANKKEIAENASEIFESEIFKLKIQNNLIDEILCMIDSKPNELI